jgi:mono/diheme cytochrome c family protein
MKRFIRIAGYGVAAVAVIIVTLVLWGHIKLNRDLDRVQEFPPLGISVVDGSVDVGNRIYSIRNGCIHCHGADLSGETFIGDFMMGTIAGPNLTPANLKEWTDEEIARAIRYGVDRDNTSLRFMPSIEYQYLSKSDIASVIAYLRSAEPIEKESPEISYGPMLKILYAFDQIPVLVAANEGIDADLNPQKPKEANTPEFGKYLVDTGCIGCHQANLEGGTVPGSPPDWPPASPLNNMVAAGYTAEKFFEAIRMGVKPDGTNLKLPMAGSTARLMTDDELGAIWKYLEAVSKQ